MPKLQPEDKKEYDEAEGNYICTDCGEPLIPVTENTGFDEPGAEHIETIGWQRCECQERTYDFE